MIKKKLILGAVLVMSISTAGRAEIEISRRMQGVNPDLAGLLRDEYSDFMFLNSANILRVDGKRVYSSMADLDANQNLFIGGAGPFMDMGKLGAFLSLNMAKEHIRLKRTHFNNATAGATVNRSRNAELEFGEYEDISTNVTREVTSASAYDNPGTISFNTILGMGDFPEWDFGIRLGYNKETEENKEYEYFRSYKNENNEDDFYRKSSDLSIKDYTSAITIAPSIRGLSLDHIEMGGTIEVGLIKDVYSDEAGADILMGSDHNNIRDFGQTETYERKYSFENNTELTGLKLGLMIDGLYELNQNTNLKGYIGGFTQKLTGERKKETQDEVLQNGGLAVDEIYSSRRTTDMENNLLEIKAMAGIERYLSEQLVLGAGAGYMRSAGKDTEKQSRMFESTDGVETYSGLEETTEETLLSSIILPIGVEWKPAAWMSFRLGSTYDITASRHTETTKFTNYDSTDEDAQISSVNTVERTLKDEIESNVSYYSGIGLEMTESLSLDLSGKSSQGNILNISNWQASATLKF